jgi:hypothetical protein
MRLTAAMVVALGMTLATLGTARAETAMGAVFGYPGAI